MASTDCVKGVEGYSEPALTCTLHVDVTWQQGARDHVCVRATISAAIMGRVQQEKSITSLQSAA